MAGVSRGPVSFSLSRDNDSNREYTVTYLVEALVGDGPLQAARASGLPAIGDSWAWVNDSDPWAFCTPYTEVRAVKGDPGEGIVFWNVTKKFSTLPLRRCQSAEIENPLAEPQRISGSFVDGKKKVTKDRNDEPIQTTSFEPVNVEVPETLPTVRIEQNVLNLQLSTFSPMIQTVNSGTLWGLDARKIRLAGASWERKFYGVCTVYYTRVFDFEVNFNTFDRSDVPNKGRKLLRGAWNASDAYVADSGASATNPADYITGVDRNGNPTEHYLTTGGLPSTEETFLDTVEVFGESNFLLLNIPSSL